MANKVVIDTEISTKNAINEIQDLTDRLNDLKYAKKQLEGKGFGLGFENYDNVIKGIADTERRLNAYKKELTSTAEVTKQVKESTNKASKSILKFGESTKKSTSSLKVGLKTILKYAFGIRSLFVLINKMRSALVDGFKNFAQFNDGVNPVNTALSNLMSALTQLKNSLATAFAPILSVIEPILTSFINKLSEAFTYIGMFFAKITGQKTFTKAVAVQQNYADSLKQTATNAKEAQKYLSGLDEVRTFTDNSTSGAGGGASSASASTMFEEVPIDSKIANIVDSLKEAFDDDGIEGIARELGENIGKWIVEGINKLKELVADVEWEEVGQAIGTFISSIPWGEIAIDLIALAIRIVEALGEAFMGLQETSPISAGILALLASVAIVMTVASIAVAIAPLATKFAEAFALALGGAGTLSEALVATFGAAATYAVGAMAILGGGALALLNFIDMLKNGFDWVKEALMLLGIALVAVGAIILGAPAVVAGVVAGIVAVVANIVIFWDEIVAFLKKSMDFIAKLLYTVLFMAFYKVVYSIGGVLETLWKTIKGIFNGIKDIFKGLIDFIVGVFTGNWKKAWDGILGIFKGIINTIISVFEGAINFLVDALNLLSIDVPDWVPVIGGKKWGFNLPKVDLPRLATGTVVPRQSKEFMAILGDNNKETEIVSPLSTIKDALVEALAENGNGGGSYRFTAQINRRTLFDELIAEAKIRQTTSGGNPFDLARA